MNRQVCEVCDHLDHLHTCQSEHPLVHVSHIHLFHPTSTLNHIAHKTKTNYASFQFGSTPSMLCSPPPPTHSNIQITHVSLHRKSLCKNMACAPGGCKKYATTKLGGGGGTNGKDPNLNMLLKHKEILS